MNYTGLLGTGLLTNDWWITWKGGAVNEDDQLCLVKDNFFSEPRNNRGFLERSLDDINLRKGIK